LFITLLVIAGRFYWIFFFLFCYFLPIGWLFVLFALSSHKTVAAMPENTKNICIVTKKTLYIYYIMKKGKKREADPFFFFFLPPFFPEGLI